MTIAVGDPHADLLRAAEVARAAYDVGLGALRPGRTFGDVVDAVRTVLDAAGGRYRYSATIGQVEQSIGSA